VSLPDIMRSIRRVLVEFGSYPGELKDSIARIQSDGNPFGEARERRCEWIGELEAPAFEPDKEFLWFPCCVPAYDPRVSQSGRASLAVLRAADVAFGLLRNGQSCCCESVRKVGAEDVFQDGAKANIAVFKDAGVRKILASSPHCCIAFEKDYPELGADFEVVHQTQLFHKLIKDGKLIPRNPLNKKVVYHDPCTLGRQRGVYEEPRETLRSIPELELVEIPDFTREHSVCCCGGSGGAWLERPKEERLSDVRVRQAADAGAQILAVACPHCLQMFEDSVERLELDLPVKDVSELLADALEAPPVQESPAPTSS
jgi:Fe-S oxidoreductase